MSNAKIFGISNTKKPFSLMRSSKCYNIWHTWTVPFHLWNGRTEMLKKKKIIHFLSFLLWLFFFSLLLFSSFFIWNLRLFLIFCHSLFLFSSSEISPLPFSFLFSITFFAPLSLSLSLSLSLHLDHCHWDRPSPWSLAWWRSYVSLASFYFYFLGCGFHVIWVV